MDKESIIKKCRTLIAAYNSGKLGYMKMPEDANPGFSKDEQELRLCYFTLPMSLNYQRDSYKLWESALKTYMDKETQEVFNISASASMAQEELRKKLTKHNLALQPNKHIETWQKIAKTISHNFTSMNGLIKHAGYDYLHLKEIMQDRHKKDFPYISGPKIFNYWCFILQQYGKLSLKNSEYIEIAPDTHITQCSVKLGVITQEEAESLTKEKISQRWRELLKDTEITPIEMHPPLWFWSRNNFQFKI